MKQDLQALTAQLKPDKLPAHIAIIMDGNGRWAKQRHRPRLYGHRAGVQAVRGIVEIASEINLSHLTLYAFSTENWSRPQTEVTGLFKLFMEFLKLEVDELNRKNVVLRIIGGAEKLDPDFITKAHKITSPTWNNTGLHLNILFNYGGRQDILQAITKIAFDAAAHKIQPSEINAELVSGLLYTAGIPDPDLVIRTSGEMRLSNFLTWQTAYSELYVTDILWPDFGKDEFLKAILDYQKRNRRFGGTND
jgi:undecaprenyl diphosphate synthase